MYIYIHIYVYTIRRLANTRLLYRLTYQYLSHLGRTVFLDDCELVEGDPNLGDVAVKTMRLAASEAAHFDLLQHGLHG